MNHIMWVAMQEYVDVTTNIKVIQALKGTAVYENPSADERIEKLSRRKEELEVNIRRLIGEHMKRLCWRER